MIAIKAGADALGFVFYEKSPRYVNMPKAQDIISKLPPFVEKVALFVNVDADMVNNTCQKVGATLAQIHFEPEDDFFSQLTVPYIKVIRAKNREDLLLNSNEYRIIDAYTQSFGGAGKQLNLEWFKDIDCSKIILAGGLTPQNVTYTKEYGFYGVDVSSGVEISHGLKDKQKVKEFIQNANK